MCGVMGVHSRIVDFIDLVLRKPGQYIVADGSEHPLLLGVCPFKCGVAQLVEGKPMEIRSGPMWPCRRPLICSSTGVVEEDSLESVSGFIRLIPSPGTGDGLWHSQNRRRGIWRQQGGINHCPE